MSFTNRQATAEPVFVDCEQYSLELAGARQQLSSAGGSVQFDPHQHPRDAHGQFIKVLEQLNINQMVEMPDGITITRRAQDYKAVLPTGGIRVGQKETAATFALDESAKSLHPESIGGERSHPFGWNHAPNFGRNYYTENELAVLKQMRSEPPKRDPKRQPVRGKYPTGLVVQSATHSIHYNGESYEVHDRAGDIVTEASTKEEAIKAMKKLQSVKPISLSLSTVTFDPRQHPRGVHGRFTDVLKGLRGGEEAQTPDGIKVKRGVGSEGLYYVMGHGKSAGQMKPETAAQTALDWSARSDHPDSFGGTQSHKFFQQVTPPEIPLAKPKPQAQQLKRLRAGLYETADGEFKLEAKKRISNRGEVDNRSTSWAILQRDNMGVHKRVIGGFPTLAKAREALRRRMGERKFEGVGANVIPGDKRFQ